MSSKSKNCEWLERVDHPLLNNVILDLVFEHLKKKELNECRLVCKTWSVLTIPYTRKAFRVTIHELHIIEKFVDDFRSNTLGIPFSRFDLGPFCTSDGVGQEFLKLCGDTITDIGFSEQLNMVDDLAELLKSTPRLEIFKIPMKLQSRSGNPIKLFPDGLENSKSRLTTLNTLHFNFGSAQEVKKYCPTFLEELMTAAQSICSLDMLDSSWSWNFEALSLIERLGRESSIQELQIQESFENESEYDDYTGLLLRMTSKPNGLRLNRFYYEAPFSKSANRRSLSLQLIPHFKDTLQCFTLNIHENACPSFMEFPRMSRLTSLDMSWFPSDYKFRGVNLNMVFPILLELKLCQTQGVANDEFFPHSDPCLKMNILKTYNIVNLTINGFNQMLTVFPNLTELNIEIGVDGEDILKQIWSQMTQLKWLDISGRIETMESLDSLLTGISGHVLQEMRVVVENLKSITNGVERKEMILELRNQLSTFPGIGSLTNLSSLTIDLTGGVKGKFITDLFGYFGLYSMKRLKNLYVHKCKLTKACCEILREEMGLETSQFWTNFSIFNILGNPFEAE